jgi:hypothetical protein
MANATWRKNNLEKVKARGVRWRENNPGYGSKWYQANKENRREIRAKYKRERSARDEYFRIAGNIRSAICRSLKENTKDAHTEELLGCSIEEFRNYLERLFKPGMTWDNHGIRGWHIDHIIPLASFDFTDPEQQKRAWHYTNLQPLWAKDNLKKSNKIEERQLLLL